jgi:OOP family OmpA-OmpF porin
MKKLNQVAIAIAATMFAAVAGAQEVHNWKNASAEPVKNSAGECWRDASWTPASAAAGCDGAIAPEVKKAEPVKPVEVAKPVEPVKTTPVVPAKVEPAPVIAQVNYGSDASFDFNKSTLKPAGKAKLDELLAKIKDAKVESIVAVGHTDSIGSDKANQKLSEKRAEAVKAYLLSKNKALNVKAEGKGEKEPVADNKTKAGQAKNRRVEVVVRGTRPAPAAK